MRKGVHQFFMARGITMDTKPKVVEALSVDREMKKFELRFLSFSLSCAVDEGRRRRLLIL